IGSAVISRITGRFPAVSTGVRGRDDLGEETSEDLLRLLKRLGKGQGVSTYDPPHELISVLLTTDKDRKGATGGKGWLGFMATRHHQCSRRGGGHNRAGAYARANWRMADCATSLNIKLATQHGW